MQSARVLRVGGTDADYRIFDDALRAAGRVEMRRASPAEAIEAIAGHNVDLLLLDLTLPGAQIVEVLRGASPGGGARSRVPVIVTAPAGYEDRVASCLQHGAEEFIPTPLDGAKPILVSRRIMLALQRRWLRDATVKLQTQTQSGRLDETAVIEVYANASNRFVPREFLEHLGRKSLAEVRLGDHVEREMTVLFTDIRDFTALSETLTPQENFDFLNSYLRRVTPIIRARHGFIDKYIGDAIMALFPRSAADALKAAVELQLQVVEYNNGRRSAGYVPIRIGIGLHHGKLILGTIGEEERMQTTVIADAVNVASRIEGLTKAFGVSLLVSGPVVEALDAGERERHHLRSLGDVQTKGKSNSIEIFECFDNDSEELLAHKDRTSEAFAAGMAEFRRGLFLTAGRIFQRIAELNAGDTAAAYYRDTCALEQMPKRGAWRQGVEKIEVT